MLCLKKKIQSKSRNCILEPLLETAACISMLDALENPPVGKLASRLSQMDFTESVLLAAGTSRGSTLGGTGTNKTQTWLYQTPNRTLEWRWTDVHSQFPHPSNNQWNGSKAQDIPDLAKRLGVLSSVHPRCCTTALWKVSVCSPPPAPQPRGPWATVEGLRSWASA